LYEGYFGLTERPFSIAPDPHYLYMSLRHKEAMAHLSYGLSQGGCFIVLTGEVGTGKTTLCRNLLSDLPENVDVALILNANINESELLQTVCDELNITYTERHTQKQLLDLINQYLLATFADNRHTVLIIDEAQLLSRNVLEQVRLLTNLETTKSKLLQIILIGQPELNDLLSRNDLRQLAQRVTARYHLGALQRGEIEEYVNYRLGVAGCRQPLFSRQALNKIHALTAGIPRKINVLADHSLLAAYSQAQSVVDAKTVKKASRDVFIKSKPDDKPVDRSRRWWVVAATFLLMNLGFWWYFLQRDAVSVVKQPEPDNPVSRLEAAPKPDILPDVEAAELVRPDSVDEAPTQSAAEESAIVTEMATDDAEPQIGQSENRESRPVTIVPSDDVEPGSVTISEEYLDAAGVVASAPPAVVESVIPNLGSAFGEILETSADITGRMAAIRGLAKEWNVSLPSPMINSACSELTLRRLSCIGVSSWPQLMRYNRPTIMVLSHQGQLHRVILKSVNADVATVLVGGTAQSLSVSELKQRWTNDALTYWRPSSAGARFLKPGDNYSNLDRTRVHLNRGLAKANMPVLDNVDSTNFDIDMSQKVFALQTRYNIVNDSKIGNETYLLLNELVAPETTPVLITRVP